MHGHAASDRVLRGFAEIAREALRATDVLWRRGGEEFMLLPDTSVPAAPKGRKRSVCLDPAQEAHSPHESPTQAVTVGSAPSQVPRPAGRATV